MKSVRYYTLSLATVLTTLLWFSVTALAQITISSGEYDVNLGETVTQFSAIDTLEDGVPVAVGSSGGPQTWSFSQDDYAGEETVISTYTVLLPGATPFGDQFPGADHAWEYEMFVPEFNDTGRVYLYFDLTDQSLLDFGNAFSFQGFTSVEKTDPPAVIIPFPLGLNTSWENSSSSSEEIGPGFVVFDSSSSQLTVDAWGTVNLPGGSYSCLRIRDNTTDISLTTVNGIPVFGDTTSSITYIWVTENLGLLASVISRDGETDPNFTLASDVTFRTTGGATAIDEEAPVLTRSYQLEQNYPNPFNPATTINFELPRSEFVSLEVFDITGKKVATLVSGKLSAGAHSRTFEGGNLPSGIYLYRLKGANVNLVKRMVLLK